MVTTSQKLEISGGLPYVEYPVKDAGVDWCSLTCKNPDFRDKFEAIAVGLIHTQAGFGEKVQPWSFCGFEGLKTEGIAYGVQDTMAMMSLKSEVAWSNWKRCFELATNCSRIDLQVTVTTQENVPKLILAHHQEAVDHYTGWLRPPQIDLRLSNKNSPTLYLNQRTSARFARIYDKFNESKLDHYKGCIRYEVQFNGKNAMQMATTLASGGASSTLAAPRVLGFFNKAGIRPRCALASTSLLSSPRRRTTAGRSLLWLDRQVRPRIHSLLDRGLTLEVLKALGVTKAMLVQWSNLMEED